MLYDPNGTLTYVQARLDRLRDDGRAGAAQAEANRVQYPSTGYEIAIPPYLFSIADMPRITTGLYIERDPENRAWMAHVNTDHFGLTEASIRTYHPRPRMELLRWILLNCQGRVRTGMRLGAIIAPRLTVTTCPIHTVLICDDQDDACLTRLTFG